jgi:hypothetical protein
MKKLAAPLALLCTTLTTASLIQAADVPSPTAATTRSLRNPAAYIPSQCYTKTQDEAGRVHNPCFSCHTAAQAPNFVTDGELQLAYSFAEPARVNRWTNLFKDRSSQVAAISDGEVEQYVRSGNYFDAAGRIAPAEALAKVPQDWDYDGNGKWQGFVPDAWFNFDADGFDHDQQGNPTGWRAFAYYPFLGTFWPTNGSTGDVLIRLPAAFRNDQKGQYDAAVYKVNLAIVEALLKEQDVPIGPVDETALGGIDLDKDGKIGTARRVVFDWAPLKQKFMSYVGQAAIEQQAGRVHLAVGLYPEGTEFLHTVRYIDVDAAGNNRLAPRMKEVRYAKKRYWLTYAQLEYMALKEIKEKNTFPDRLRTIRGNAESGVSNGQGWVYAGMIEDAQGRLRPQSFEESAFCVGCHSGIGATRDGIFSFHRKFDAARAHRRGWHHWSQKGPQGVPDRLRSDGLAEYAHYLKANRAGDEFRANPEVMAKYFEADGREKSAAVARLRDDIAELLFASRERAAQLNKAYWLIVREQSFVEGRDATVAPVANVHRQVDAGQETGVKAPLLGY